MVKDGQSCGEVTAARELKREEERVHHLITNKKTKGEDGILEHKATLTLKEAKANTKDTSDKENNQASSTISAASARKRK